MCNLHEKYAALLLGLKEFCRKKLFFVGHVLYYIMYICGQVAYRRGIRKGAAHEKSFKTADNIFMQQKQHLTLGDYLQYDSFSRDNLGPSCPLWYTVCWNTP